MLRLDVAVREPDLTAGLVAHLQGRGVWGVVWALRALHHRRRRAVQREAYGERREQFGELRLPDGDGPVPRGDGAARRASGARAGSSTSWTPSASTSPSAASRRGTSSTGVPTGTAGERPCRTSAAASTTSTSSPRAGHSTSSASPSSATPRAARWRCSWRGTPSAARVPHVRLVVQLAGLVDLVGTHRRDIGNGAVVTALGGTPEERPQAYAQASPLERVPVGVPQAVVIGRSESPDLREMSRRYVRAAAGCRATTSRSSRTTATTSPSSIPPARSGAGRRTCSPRRSGDDHGRGRARSKSESRVGQLWSSA